MAAALPSELSELIEISRAIGRDPDLVQGGGGNTSVKSRDRKTMFIKASGSALAEMDGSRGWAELDLEAARDVIGDRELAGLDPAAREKEVLRLLEAAVKKPCGARPSVESSLHALLGRVVIHTHPVGLNAFLCSRGSRAAYRKLIGDKHGAPLYVPYVDPGYILALRVARGIDAYWSEHDRHPTVVLLENHGLFVSAEEPAACLKISREITDLGKKWIGGERINPLEVGWTVESAPAAKLNGASLFLYLAELRGALLKAGCAPLLLRRDDSAIASDLLEEDTAATAAGHGAFTPDQIVYCRARPLILKGGSLDEWPAEVADYRERHGDPRVVLVRPGPRKDGPGGVYYCAPDLAQLRVVSEVYRGAMAALLGSAKNGGPRFLDREQTKFIEGWEVEKFRAALLAGGSPRLAGRIGLVTGAASGLGKGIARGLIAAGATVIALDLNRDALAAVRAEVPAGRYLPCVGDVTDEVSIAAAFRTLEASAGGIDFLVNAAGIAPSFPLVDFPLGAWKKTLDINLTGYFLCAREAARLMTR